MKDSARKTALFLLLLTVIPDVILMISLCTGYIVPNQNFEKYGIRWNIVMLDKILSPYSMFILWVGLWIRWLSEKDMERFFKIIWSVSIIEYFAYHIIGLIYSSANLEHFKGMHLLFIPLFLSFLIGSVWVWIKSKYFSPRTISGTDLEGHHESLHDSRLQGYCNRLYTLDKFLAGFPLLLMLILTISDYVLFKTQITVSYIAGSLGVIAIPLVFCLLNLFPLFILKRRLKDNVSGSVSDILMGVIISEALLILLLIGSYCYVVFLMAVKFRTFSSDYSINDLINTFVSTTFDNSFIMISLSFILTYMGYKIGLIIMKKQSTSIEQNS